MFNEVESICESIIKNAQIHPDKLCIADEHNAMSYAEYADKILRCVTVPEENGVKKVIAWLLKRHSVLTILP